MKNVLIGIMAAGILMYTTSCAQFNELIGQGGNNWPNAAPRIEAAMVTPLFVLQNNNAVKTQAKQLKQAQHFNSVASLIDLQSGRPYIFPGRDATTLNSKTKKNIETVLDAGITPILIIRNDWAARTGTGSIPSVNGQVGNSQFYSASILANEKIFVESLKGYYKYIHIQLNIEPDDSASAQFALAMAAHLRAAGFKNKIIINPILRANNAHENIRGQLDQYGVVWARSRNSDNFGGDPIINTDGNNSINSGSFKDWLNKIRGTGREYIIWSGELANSPDSIPDGYIK